MKIVLKSKSTFDLDAILSTITIRKDIPRDFAELLVKNTVSNVTNIMSLKVSKGELTATRKDLRKITSLSHAMQLSLIKLRPSAFLAMKRYLEGFSNGNGKSFGPEWNAEDLQKNISALMRLVFMLNQIADGAASKIENRRMTPKQSNQERQLIAEVNLAPRTKLKQVRSEPSSLEVHLIADVGETYRLITGKKPGRSIAAGTKDNAGHPTGKFWAFLCEIWRQATGSSVGPTYAFQHWAKLKPHGWDYEATRRALSPYDEN